MERIAEATENTPFQGRVWLVGGAVRDAELGLADSHDYDLVVEGDALALAHLLRERGVSAIEPTIYPAFGTALILVEGESVELITARKESYRDSSRKPIQIEPATLYEDALRRDLTINTLLRNIRTQERRDPTGLGLGDLRARIARTPDDPERMIHEDPLRMLRIVRFRYRFELSYAPGLQEAIQTNASRLSVVSAERIQDEFVKILCLSKVREAVTELRDLGLLNQFLPEIVAMTGVTQGKWHRADVFDHTMHVVEAVRPEPTMRLAALFHDVGKPSTWQLDEDGNIRFFGHENVGAQMCESILKRLRFSHDVIHHVRLLVKNHMRLGSASHLSVPAARRLLRDLEGHEEDLLQLVGADADSLKVAEVKIPVQAIRERLAEVEAIVPVRQLQSPLSGAEIMEMLGLEPGPEVGQWKFRLQELVIQGDLPPGDKEAARAWLKANA